MSIPSPQSFRIKRKLKVYYSVAFWGAIRVKHRKPGRKQRSTGTAKAPKGIGTAARRIIRAEGWFHPRPPGREHGVPLTLGGELRI